MIGQLRDFLVVFHRVLGVQVHGFFNGYVNIRHQHNVFFDQLVGQGPVNHGGHGEGIIGGA